MGWALPRPSCMLARQRGIRMNLLSRVLPHNLPAFVRGKLLAELVEATADAFECPAPTLDHLAYDERLRSYALFSREQAEKALSSGRNLLAIKTHLYQNAYPLGARLRKWFGVDAMSDVMVNGCYFSQFYSGPVCDLISALDDGVFSGLLGGGRLAFSERITEGRQCCRAKLQLERSR